MTILIFLIVFSNLKKLYCMCVCTCACVLMPKKVCIQESVCVVGARDHLGCHSTSVHIFDLKQGLSLS